MNQVQVTLHAFRTWASDRLSSDKQGVFAEAWAACTEEEQGRVLSRLLNDAMFTIRACQEMTEHLLELES